MVKQGYKQTEIGAIPEDWKIRRIGDFTHAVAGGTPSTYHPEYWNGEILWMSSGELNNRRIYNVIGRITELGYKNSSTHLIPKNCVLMGLAGQGKTRGTVAINYVELCTNQSIAAIYPSNKHCSEFLYQNLWNRYDELRELSSGDGGRGGLNLKIIKDLPCVFPNLPEQKGIAEALSDVDSMITSLEKLIEKKKAIKQGAMQELLTGKKRLPGFSGEWDTIHLGKISKIKTGDKNNEEKADNGKYPFFVRSQQVEKINTFSFDGEAILVPGEGNIGQIFHYINGKFDWHQRVYKVSDFPEFICGKYVYYQMKFSFGEYALKNTVKATVDSLRLPTFETFEFLISPTAEEQIAIASILSDMDSEIEALEQKLAKTRQLKQGMMQQLLTGKIRLV